MLDSQEGTDASQALFLRKMTAAPLRKVRLVD
jgi:hypothetical protein